MRSERVENLTRVLVLRGAADLSSSCRLDMGQPCQDVSSVEPRHDHTAPMTPCITARQGWCIKPQRQALSYRSEG